MQNHRRRADYNRRCRDRLRTLRGDRYRCGESGRALQESVWRVFFVLILGRLRADLGTRTLNLTPKRTLSMS